VAMTTVLELVKELAGDFPVRQRPGGEEKLATRRRRSTVRGGELGYDPVWDLRRV
jgi:hypothetical protein